jgi:hypothetical protein
MDYGGAWDMGNAAISAAQGTYQQSVSAGMTSKIGITPMIGVNDVAGEVFSLSDAQDVYDFAQRTAWVSSLGMWSSNRDVSKSGPLYASSQITQADYAFARILNRIT